MIKTIQLDIMLTFGIGLLFVLWRGELSQNEPFWRQKAYRGGMFYVLLGVGIAVLCYLINPSWMWMYWVNPDAIPWWHMAGIIFLGYPAWYTLGYLIGGELEKVALGLRAFLILLATIILSIAITIHRLWAVSTYADYHAGISKPLLSMKPLSVTLLAVTMTLLLPVMVYLLFWSHKRLKEE